MSESYPKINATNASQILSLYRSNQLSQRELVDLTTDTFDKKSSAGDLIGAAIHRCLEIYDEYSVDNKNFRTGEFDHDLARLFHEEAEIEEHWARDPGLWVWVTFAFNSYGAFLVDRRFSKSGDEEKGKALDKHYGLGSLHAGLFAKCWIHADISIKATDDYSLLEMTDVDFWDSHILGVDYGHSMPMCYAFFKLIKDKNISRGNVNDQSVPIGYRDLAKELTRRNPTVCYELMDKNVAYEYIENLWDSRTSWSLKNE